MRTIGRHFPRESPKNDFETLCGYCGVAYYRSQLRRDRAELLACKECGEGRDVVTLSEGNAAAANRPRVTQNVRDGGGWDHEVSPAPPVKVWPDGVRPI